MKYFVPELSRRDFLRFGGLGVAGYSLLPMLQPLNVQAKEKSSPRGGAEICIFIFLQGAPAQMDTFDAKEGTGTPDDFDFRTIKQGLLWPMGTMPMLGKRTDKFAIVRSMEFWDNEHGRGTYYVQAGRPFSPARVKEIPSIGSVVAYESLSQRKDSDFLPPMISIDMDQDFQVGCGFLPPSCAPMNWSSRNNPMFLMPDAEKEEFEIRRQFLSELDRQWKEEATHRGRIFGDIDEYCQSAYRLSDPKASTIFDVSREEHVRYGDCHLAKACAMARNIAEADAGTKFVFINHSSWDIHDWAYRKNADGFGSLQYTMNKQLDTALANLLDDLETRTDANGRPLIDKTLIVCMGEFGRTPQVITERDGRDHYKHSGIAVFAGAGVQGGRIIGATSEDSAKVIDPGWRHDRSIYPDDVLVTLYSTMGIDWTKKISQTPSGRAFEYIEYISPKGPMQFSEISELFA
jgi:hypothetical protein